MRRNKWLLLSTVSILVIIQIILLIIVVIIIVTIFINLAFILFYETAWYMTLNLHWIAFIF